MSLCRVKARQVHRQRHVPWPIMTLARQLLLLTTVRVFCMTRDRLLRTGSQKNKGTQRNRTQRIPPKTELPR
eukprot:6079595-Amphidinium_carterae.1